MTTTKVLWGVVAACLLLPACAQAQSSSMAVQGQGSVNRNGAAAYRVPLALPPGVAGLEPRLALTYNSHAGNGLLGVGWSLAGLSSITRCQQTAAQDGAARVGGIGYVASDRFCLDGQRLMAVPNPAGGTAVGAYGADQTHYGTELESFSKIRSEGTQGNGAGPTSFTVWTRDGLKMEYGATTDSRILAVGKTAVRVWALSRITDAKGNAVAFQYNGASDARQSEDGEAFVSRITYAPNVVVDFLYSGFEGRPDTSTYREGGAHHKVARLLETIRVSVASAATQEWRLGYQAGGSPATARSRLESLQQCQAGANGACLPALNFGWTTALAGLTGMGWTDTAEGFTAASAAQTPDFIVGDFNGDGKDDLVAQWDHGGTLYLIPFYASGDGFVVGPVFNTQQGFNSAMDGRPGLLAMDINGDGVTDLVQQWNNATLRLLPIFGSANGFSVGTWFDTLASYNTVSPTGGPGLIIGDFNGDGRSDLVMQWNDSGTLKLLPIYSTGNSFATGLWFNTGQGFASASAQSPGLLAGDFNGDGRTDLVQQWNRNGLLEVLPIWATATGLASDGNWFATGLDFNAGPDGTPGLLVGDFNGDGKSDLVTQWNNAGTLHVMPIYSTGVGFVKGAWYNTQQGFASGHGGTPNLRTGDVDGDGRTDLIQMWKRSGKLSLLPILARRDGFAIGTWFDSTEGYESIFNTNPGLLVMDQNGDGRTDFIQQWNKAGSISLYVYRATSQGDLLASVSQGATVLAGFEHAVLPQVLGTDYILARTPGCQQRCERAVRMPVVTAHKQADGLGALRVDRYKYGNLVRDPDGRGLVFGWVQRRDELTGLVGRTAYRQDWPHAGLVEREGRGTSEANWSDLALVTHAYTCTDYTSASGCVVQPGRRYFSYASTVEATGLKDLTASGAPGAGLPGRRTTQVIDLWGNVTDMTVTTLKPDGSGSDYKTVTQNVYAPADTAAWRLGRLLRSTVQSTGTAP